MQSTPASNNNGEARDWWNSLPEFWKQVFLEVGVRVAVNSSSISDEDLHTLYTTTVLRIVGPDGSNPNFSGQLHDLEGLRGLEQLEYLFVMHCGLESLHGIEDHVQLKSLFVQNNRLTHFHEIRKMAGLTELYITSNQIDSLEPLEHCKLLETVCCENNQIKSLEGIKPFHEQHLKAFKCRPNDLLPQREIIRVQNTYGILCN
jgi:hypothetical protein